jgi:hypothetical protein
VRQGGIIKSAAGDEKGYFRNDEPQPDDREHRQGGDDEACMAVLNDFYGDGERKNVMSTNHSVNCRHKVARRGVPSREANYL